MPIQYFEAPQMSNPPSLFLGGGITGVPDSQTQMITMLVNKKSGLRIFNPRRKDFDINNPDVTRQQIRWENEMLRMSNAILFWFARETIQPIVLFELGAHLMIAGKPIFIGMDAEYPRRVDVEIQTEIIRPDIQMVYSLENLADQVIAWESTFNSTVGLCGNVAE